MQLVLIRVKARREKAVQVQEVLTDFGCDIALRLGMHEVGEGECANDGLIILQLKSGSTSAPLLQGKLEKIGDVCVKTIEF